MELKGRTVLVTGPTTGIGRRLAGRFAAAGAELILVSRDAGRLERLESELKSRFGTRARSFAVDLAKEEGVEELLALLSSHSIRVDVLVNNAGYGVYGFFHEEPIEPQIGMIRLHVMAPTRLCHALIGGMLERRFGGILNIASTAAFQPLARQNVYSSTKSYLVHFTEALAEETLGRGVTVCCYCPGPTETPFFDNPLMKTRVPGKLVRMSAEAVGDGAFRAFMRGDVLGVAGAFNRLLLFSVKLTPRWITRKVAARIIERVLPEGPVRRRSA